MPTTTATGEWIRLPSGLFVSNGRMQKDGKLFTLYEAANMDLATFNKEAAQYVVHIDETDAPIDRLVKYSIFLSRRDKNGSQVLTNEEYVDMLLEVAAGKAKEPFTSLYKALKVGHLDATKDVLEFHGKVSKGPNRGKYEVKLLRFDEYGRLQPIDEILVAPSGWIEAVGAKRKYPVETRKYFTRIQNIEVPGIEENDASGYWNIGDEPREGEQRIDIHDPFWLGGNLLGARAKDGRSSREDAGALRVHRTP